MWGEMNCPPRWETAGGPAAMADAVCLKDPGFQPKCPSLRKSAWHGNQGCQTQSTFITLMLCHPHRSMLLCALQCLFFIKAWNSQHGRLRKEVGLCIILLETLLVLCFLKSWYTLATDSYRHHSVFPGMYKRYFHQSVLYYLLALRCILCLTQGAPSTFVPPLLLSLTPLCQPWWIKTVQLHRK